MIIKDGDFYSALTHLKEARILLSDGNMDMAFAQVVEAEIALKSAITDELDENGKVGSELITCSFCGYEFSLDKLEQGYCPCCGEKY